MNEISGIISTIAIVAAGLWAFFRVRVERSHTPHIEMELDCNLHGPENDNYIAEMVIIVNNRGLVRQDFQSMTLKIRGIGEGEELNFYMEQRLAAPTSLLNAQVIKKKTNEDFLYVEPGVKHLITYTTKLPVYIPESNKKIKYFIARAKFNYDEKTPHSIERLYSIEQCLNRDVQLYCRKD